MRCSVILCGVLLCAPVQPGPTHPTPDQPPHVEPFRAHPIARQDAADQPEPDRVVEIVIERFLFTPSKVTIEAGTTVEFRLTSEDTDHGFRIVGPGDTDIDVDIPKRNRGTASVYFAPTEPGEYRFECSRICGAGHLYMSGVIEVTAASSETPAERGSR